MKWLLTPLLLALALPVWGGSLSLDPAAVSPGGVSWLEYQGGAEVVTARFQGRPLRLQRRQHGARRLLGVDLELAPGRYPVEVLASSPDGRSEQLKIVLEVVPLERPVEHLQLPDEMVSPKRPETLERIARERRLLQELFHLETPPLVQSDFSRPVADPLGSGFGLRRVLNGIPKSPHGGVDFRSQRGTPVHAPASARVAYRGELYYTGQTVILDHGGGLLSLYAHLDSIAVAPGALLTAGRVVGTVGSSGRATGPHLHWGVRLGDARVDPLAVVAAFAGKSLD